MLSSMLQKMLEAIVATGDWNDSSSLPDYSIATVNFLRSFSYEISILHFLHVYTFKKATVAPKTLIFVVCEFPSLDFLLVITVFTFTGKE
jgi:hypothetical protein